MKSALLGAVATLAILSASAAQAEMEWSQKSYMRIGTGQTEGKEFTEMQLDGAWRKYRLGNEASFYADYAVHGKYKLDNGSALVGSVRADVEGNNNDLIINGKLKADFTLRDMWLGYQGLGEGAFSESTIWFGRRPYKSKDIHITDNTYEDYANYAGVGTGLENIDVGYGQLSLAAFTNSDRNTHTFDTRLEGIQLAEDLIGEVGAAYTLTTGDALGGNGAALRLHLQKNGIFGGYMKASLMHGINAAAGFSGDGWGDKDRSISRAQVHGLASITDDVELFYTAWHQLDRDKGVNKHWSSVGVRPQYNINEHFNLQLEAGLDFVNDEQGKRYLGKTTLAAAYTFGKSGFWARPQLRAFVTHGRWSEKGAVRHTDIFGNKKSGTTIGVQFENWF